MKKKLLITGGAGSIGTTFIKVNYDKYDIYNISRSEINQINLKRNYPNVTNFTGYIEDQEFMFLTFEKVKPDIVIHAAAQKDVANSEKHPIQAARANIIGSLNVIKASLRSDVPITIAISTDKACAPDNVYGSSKYLMERFFLEANTKRNKFACTRFANVSHSRGSVIPFWLKKKEQGQPLPITDPSMNRLMFTKKDAIALVNKAIKTCEEGEGGFILSKMMKNINIGRLAKMISDNTEIIGKKPGEKVDEDLISKKEIPFTYIDGNYVFIRKEENKGKNKLKKPLSSEYADEMTDEEVKKLIQNEPVY